MEALFDAHCHLAAQPPHPGVCGRSEITGRLLCAASAEEWGNLAATVPAWPGAVAAFGVHPWFAVPGRNTWLVELNTLLRRFPQAWIGEIGLDAKKSAIAPMEDQEYALAAQLALARCYDRPVNLHCVAAHERLLALLDAHYLTNMPRPFIIHAFAGPYQYIDSFAERGAYFTVGPLLFRHNSRKARARAALFPAERLLLESDAFLYPCRDATEDLRFALAWLADCRQCAPEVMATTLNDNARRLFHHVIQS